MRRGVLFLLAATLLAAPIFVTWPGIDLAVSARFYDPVSGSWMAESPPLSTLRNLLWTSGRAAGLVFGLLFLLSLARRARSAVPARLWGFAFLSMLLGPGLLVTLVLKDHWGRARPRTVAEFGGEAIFTPAFRIADQCLRNCSFVSGEVAMTAGLAMIAWLVFSPRLAGAARRRLAALLLALTAFSMFLRIAAGGHFLSDALFAALFTALVTLAVWRLTRAGQAAPRLTARALREDLVAPLRALRK